MGKGTLFVTSFYSNLWGTKMGGRPSRFHHYLGSLKTLMNMNCDFVVYTTEEEKNILLNEPELSSNPRLRLQVYDLESHPNHEYFQQKIAGRPTDRCYEIMHGKTKWIKEHINDGYDYVYWIDCGLSHGGLFPIKYRGGSDYATYYKCSLFNPIMVENLNEVSENKITLLCAIQDVRVLEAAPNYKFFETIPSKSRQHVIGGLFGGKTELVNALCDKFEVVVDEMKSYDVLEHEEHLLTVLLNREEELYNVLYFSTWHHEDSDMAQYNFENEPCFYSIFEKLNEKN